MIMNTIHQTFCHNGAKYWPAQWLWDTWGSQPLERWLIGNFISLESIYKQPALWGVLPQSRVGHPVPPHHTKCHPRCPRVCDKEDSNGVGQAFSQAKLLPRHLDPREKVGEDTVAPCLPQRPGSRVLDAKGTLGLPPLQAEGAPFFTFKFFSFPSGNLGTKPHLLQPLLKELQQGPCRALGPIIL